MFLVNVFIIGIEMYVKLEVEGIRKDKFKYKIKVLMINKIGESFCNKFVVLLRINEFKYVLDIKIDVL